MKRIILAISLILLLGAGSLTSLLFLRKNSREVEKRAAHILSLCNSGDTEKAIEYTQDFSEYWEKISLPLNVLVDTDRISTINSSIYKIEPFIQSDSDELNAELESIMANARWLYECEKPMWYNVF